MRSIFFFNQYAKALFFELSSSPIFDLCKSLFTVHFPTRSVLQIFTQSGKSQSYELNSTTSFSLPKSLFQYHFPTRSVLQIFTQSGKFRSYELNSTTSFSLHKSLFQYHFPREAYLLFQCQPAGMSIYANQSIKPTFNAKRFLAFLFLRVDSPKSTYS